MCTRLCVCGLALVLLAGAGPAQAISISWHVVDNYGNSIMLTRNSHCTAAANVAKYHGLQRPGESDERLVTLAYMYVKQCQCGPLRDLPVHWFIAEGLRRMFETRYSGTFSVRERATNSKYASERVDWNHYVAAINANRPVAISYCYDSSAAAGVEAAKGRYQDCFSICGIGYMNYGGQKLIIAHDGATSDAQVGPAAGARLDPTAMGLNAAGKPWGRPGTTLYKWNGGQANLLLVFTDL